MPYLSNEPAVFYRVWNTECPKANVVFLHGAGEHSGLYHRFAAGLNAEGYRVWAIDHIAHGHTPGSVEAVYEVSALADNARRLIRLAQEETDALKTVLIGNSLGGVTAGLLMSMEDAPAIAGLVLTSTPLAPLQNIDELDKAIMSLEPTYLDELASDPLLPRMEPLDYNRLDAAMCKAVEQMQSKAPCWPFPVLLINGENDVLALPETARAWAKNIPRGRALTIKGGHHDILNDTSYAVVTRLIASFVLEATNPYLLY